MTIITSDFYAIVELDGKYIYNDTILPVSTAEEAEAYVRDNFYAL